MNIQMKSTPTPEQKASISQLCDAESYIPTIVECLDEKQAKQLRPHHMANFMALAAELFLTNYEGIATAFERNNGLEVTFKAKLAQEKDHVEISFKPVDTYKDSASANLPDEDQSEFDFKRPPMPKPTTEDPVVVDAEEVPLGLPAPVMALPEPNNDGFTPTCMEDLDDLNDRGDGEEE